MKHLIILSLLIYTKIIDLWNCYDKDTQKLLQDYKNSFKRPIKFSDKDDIYNVFNSIH